MNQWMVRVIYDHEVESEVWGRTTGPNVQLTLDCDDLLSLEAEVEDIRDMYAEGLVALRRYAEPGNSRRGLRRMWRSTYEAALNNQSLFN